MEIKGKVHCFFEQSGTFKREFIKLGIPAEDYDIQNNFGETDHVIDLFAEIEKGYDGQPSIWDGITNDDLIVAFFPCIYFSALSQMCFFWGCTNYRKKTTRQKTEKILQRTKNREKFYSLAVKMLTVAEERGLRLIMENPWGEQTYLKANFVKAPDLVDMNRTRRGDYFVKPTAFWYINCTPTFGYSFQKSDIYLTHDTTKGSKQAGLCSEERSMISPDYARNFICDFIIGKEQAHTERTLFDL